MKIIHFLIPLLLVFLGASCEKEEIRIEQSYIFIKPLCTTVTVGGFVGIAEKCFKVGDLVKGDEIIEGTIKIRIAEHSYLNNGKVSSYSYQEFLNVPLEYLELLKK